MKILCVLCIFCGVSSAFALDRNALTFARYDLQVRVDPAKQNLDVSGIIQLRNDSAAPQRSAVLQISSTLQWKSILAEGKPLQVVAQDYTSDIDHTGALNEAIVNLPRELPPKGTVELEVSYDGPVPAESDRLARIGTPPDMAARSDWDRISPEFTAVRGVGYVTWYPIVTEAASLSEGDAVFATVAAWQARQSASSMRLLVCGPAGGNSVVLTNGEPAGASAGEAPGCRRAQYEPAGITVPTFVIAPLRVLDHGALRLFHAAGHEQVAAGWFRIADGVQPLITRWFGPPRRKVQVVELPEPKALPFESGGMLLMPLSAPEPQQLELTLAHQLTHAAFGSPRPWMHEGLAHFAQALQREQQVSAGSGARPAGRKAAIAYMDQQLPPLVQAEQAQLPESPRAGAESTPPPNPGQPLVTATDQVFYRTKAMFVWWMLRDMVGDQALQHAIQAYRAEQDKEPSYFQRLLAGQAHRDLEWFFDDWVYRDRGLPDLRLASAYPRALLPAGYSVTVTIENGGNAGAEVPLSVHADHGDLNQRVEIHAREKSVVRVPAPEVPREAIVNDGSVPEYNMGNNSVEIKLPGQK
jgi:hypothetical protein